MNDGNVLTSALCLGSASGGWFKQPLSQHAGLFLASVVSLPVELGASGGHLFDCSLSSAFNEKLIWII